MHVFLGPIMRKRIISANDHLPIEKQVNIFSYGLDL